MSNGSIKDKPVFMIQLHEHFELVATDSSGKYKEI